MNLSFARDIRPLFTDQDVAHMSYIFDLSTYADVKANAELIYERLADQSMPPGQPWPDEQVARFRRWIDEGMDP
ncbi:MAG: hypothetical protein DCC55_08455 [Chloroflexi bacterium]|nr:MAG: hypothetical protein DCC55_08455 [Chloroflexota bacterium]